MRRRLGQRYELGEEIGSGATSTVHVGRLLGTAGFTKLIAIKRLHAHLAGDRALRGILIDEARLVSRISHPNVVAVLDVAEEDGELFLVLEYARGATLAELMGAGPLPPALVVRIMRDALAGLHAAHHARDAKGASLELVHRDVSPRNVVATTDGIGKILDFGIARARARLTITREGQVRGSLPYMAPEQIRDEALTARTDVYAASVVLWEALTGTRLFAGESEAAVLQKILDHDVRAPSTVVAALPRALDEVVLKGLASRPEERFASGLEMAVALEGSFAMASSAEVAEWVMGLREGELAGREARINGDADADANATADAETDPRTSANAGAGQAWRGRALWGAGALLVIVLGAGAWARREAAPAPGADRAVSTTVGAGSAKREEAAAPDPSGTATTATSRAAASTAPAASAPTANRPTANAPVAPAARSASGPPTGAASSVKAAECPPYYVDDAGVRRFNRECLQ